MGYTYASYLLETKFNPNFYRKLEAKDNTRYILLRLRQTHDIWHLVTGFGTDVVGELGLQAFMLAQTRRPMSVVLIAGGLLKILLQCPNDLEHLLNSIAMGYRMGAKLNLY
ncbi:MAG: Coq4 family protein [Microcoleaceae cyanobacterium]